MQQDLSPPFLHHNFPPLIYRSPVMTQTMMLAQRAADTDANVLILGENGTGKELVARYVHQHSKRSLQTFLPVDLGTISETVFESEMFGHERGAFTNAQQTRKGRFRAACGGTLFLDEIGNLSLALQTKLLTALEQRRVTPVGSDCSQPVNVRIVAATNSPAEKLADPSLFRTDLLFRLNTVELYLPPLRERPEDIPPLLDYYLQLFSERYHRCMKTVSPDIYAALQRWPWPGNIRGLRHSAERAVILSVGKSFTLEDFRPTTTSMAASQRFSCSTDTMPTTAALNDLNLSRLERKAVTTALNKHGYNISHAARDLGITRATLYRRMEKFGL